jgi:hypothetical protein
LLVVLLVPTSVLSQKDVNVSVSNYLRYGTGTETVSSFSKKRDYFENLTESRISFSDFLVGFRLLFDSPPEYGVEFTGLKKRYLEFKKDDLSIRAGNSFSLYGRGLALNLFENRGLAFDTGIDGLKMEYKTRLMKLALTGGDIKYVDVLDLTRTEQYQVRAGAIEVSPYSFFSFGMNFVSGKFRLPPPAFPDHRAQFDIPEYFCRARIADVDLYASYAEKRTTEYGDTTGTHLGTAFYGSLAYTQEAFGVSLEYKDYRFGIPDPYDREDRNRAKKAYAFQNAPIVFKEHTFTLLSRYPHVIDFNDEVGYQADVFFTLWGQLTGSINASVASRHYSFAPTGDTSAIFLPIYGSKPRKNSFLPSLESKYSPFWEAYLDLLYYLEEGGNDYVEIAFNRRSNVVAEKLPTLAVERTRTTAVPLAVQYSLSSDWALKFVSEHQWVYESTNHAQTDYYNHLFSLGLSKSPDYSVTLRYEFTSDRGTIDRRRNWTALDFAFQLSNSHRITLTAGGDRGGQICANGVCRIVNPFLGFRASIVSYL